MAVENNTTTSADMIAALDEEFVFNYKQEADRLIELLGITGVETVSAGTAIYQVKITGELATDAVEEGDLVALSKYKAERIAIDAVEPKKYRKLTTAEAILKAGPAIAVTRTDAKMASQARNVMVSDFFAALGNGTGTATGKTLQATLALADAALADAMESKGDEGANVVHFINRQDAAAYLGEASITTQTVAGLTYLESFLGIPSVFLTNKVEKGSLYVTSSENLHAFGVDFSGLADGGLVYSTDASGLVGVSHDPVKNRAAVETNVMSGLKLFPEVTDYIVKGTIAPTA